MIDHLGFLLNSDRPDDMLVAFSSEKNIEWRTFCDDIKRLTVQLAEHQALRWAICCEDSYLFSVAFFATACANKKIILPGNHQPEMLNTLSAEFDEMLNDQRLNALLNKKALCLNITLAHSDLSKISVTLFTSGSTGQPKALIKTLGLLDNEIQQLEKNWGKLLTDKQIVSTVSHQHIYGLLFRLLWPLCAKRPFACHDLVYPEQVVDNAKVDRVLISSPALLKRLTESAQYSGYGAIFSSGGPLTYEAAVQTLKTIKQLPIEVFGSTETGGIGYRQQTNEHKAWEFFDGLTAAVDDRCCLKLKSPWIKGSDWYQTEDQCLLIEKQQFSLLGRLDNIVKIEEKRVSIIEVEQRINALPWIKESAVLLLTDTQRVCLGAVLVLNEHGISEISRLGKGKFWILLRQQLRLWIEPVAVPRHFKVLREIPVNKQSKRSHTELIKLFTE